MILPLFLSNHRLRLSNLAVWMLLLLPVVASISFPVVVHAQETISAERELDLKVQAISDGLRCPTCQGSSVKDSDASFSRQIKEKVRKMVIEGQTEEMIHAYFVTRYGEWILRAPKKEGLGLVLWFLPVVLLVGVGTFLSWRVYRNSKRKVEEGNSEDSGGEDVLSPEQRARLARDLKRFEEQD